MTPHSANRHSLHALPLLFITVTMWAIGPLFVKYFTSYYNVWAQNAFRYGCAAVALLAVMAVRGRLRYRLRRDQWGRLRPLPPFRLVQLVLYHPAHLLVPADLQDPPPNWNSSKWFYWLNIPNTTTMTPFAKYM